MITRAVLILSVGLLNACAMQPCAEFDRYAALKGGVDPLTSEEFTPAGASYLRCLADRGDKHAQFRLGYAYENGVGLDQDTAQAVAWYQKAAEEVVATNYVYQGAVGSRDARMLPVGDGGIRLGLPEAKYALALLYLNGKGVDPDSEKAIGLLNEAADAGHTDARQLLLQIHP